MKLRINVVVIHIKITAVCCNIIIVIVIIIIS